MKRLWVLLFQKNFPLPHSRHSSSGRLDYLDSLRGIAALAVIGWHYFQAYNTPPGCNRWLTKPLITLFYDGGAAVCIFFVLSGFVLALKPIRQYGNHYSLRGELVPFIITRAARILLPYWAILLLSHCVWRCFYSMPPTIPQANPWLLGLWQGPAAHDLRAQFMFSQMSYLPQGWTLSVEWTCSLILPFMLLVANDGILYLALFILLYLVSFGTNLIWLVSFGIGIAMAIHLEDIRTLFSSVSLKRKYAFLFIGLMILDVNTIARYIGMISLPLKEYLMSQVAIITTVGAALVILCVLVSRRIQGMLQHKILLFYGRTSYSIYLLHMLVIVSITPKVLSLLNAHGVRGVTTANICGYLCTVAATTLLSAISYAFIEKPAILLGRSVVAWCQSMADSKNSD